MKLTTDGVYSAASAYAVQFYGSYPTFDSANIWSADVEPKCKFFAWLSLHGCIHTADMLAIRGWTHDPRCQLCLQAPVTATHLCKDYPFSVAVWNQVINWTNEDLPMANFLPEPSDRVTG